MKLIHRVGYYLGGFSLGVIAVIFFWGGQNASCSYFPNARVLKEIRYKTQKISPEARQFFQQNKIDTVVIHKLLSQGNVDFGRSKTDRDAPCRVYVIDGKHMEKTIEIRVKECKANDTLAVIFKAKFIAEPD